MKTGADIGACVARVRNARGVAAEVLAARASVTRSYISKLESGHIKELRYSTISRIAVALGFDGADQMMGEPIVTAADLGALFDERYGINGIQRVIDQAAQDAPESATRPASSREADRGRPDGAPAQQPETTNRGQRRPAE